MSEQNDVVSGQNDTVKPEVGACGPGCNCGSTGIGKGSKWLICGVVVLAAVGVTVARISGAKTTGQKAQGFALPVGAAGAVATDAAWGIPLKGMSELNLVATNKDAVFVVIPSDDNARTEAIQKEVAAASAVITGRGTKTGKFLLSKNAEDYKGVVTQVGAPAVVTMVKGCGMAVVADKEITQEALLKAFVGASRPRSSGCGTSACDPSSSGCN